MALPLMAVATVASAGAKLAGQGKALKGQKARAKAEADALRGEAKQLRDKAVYERAIGHFDAARYKKEADRVLGTQRTQVAASGLATDDAGAQFNTRETIREASVNELLIMHQRDMEAKGMDDQAAENERAANAGLKAAKIERRGMMLGFAGEWADLYGGISGGGAKSTIGKSKGGTIRNRSPKPAGKY